VGIDPLKSAGVIHPPEAFPYEREIIDQAFAPLILTAGITNLSREEATMIGYDQFVKRKARDCAEAGTWGSAWLLLSRRPALDPTKEPG
jgi:hypothetical protein